MALCSHRLPFVGYDQPLLLLQETSEKARDVRPVARKVDRAKDRGTRNALGDSTRHLSVRTLRFRCCFGALPLKSSENWHQGFMMRSELDVEVIQPFTLLSRILFKNKEHPSLDGKRNDLVGQSDQRREGNGYASRKKD